MRHPVRTWVLFLLPLLAAAQSAPEPRKYLVATAIYLDASKADFSAMPAPPAPGSLAAEADLETILQLQGWRSPEEVAFAKRVDHLEAFDGAEAIGPWFSRAQLPRLGKLLDEALGDGEGMNYVAKLRYKRLRPPFQDSRVRPCTPVQQPTGATPPASFYSYPSGHATSIYLLAELLGELLPARRQALQDWAHRAAWSRIIAGVHFPSDDIGGRLLAAITVRALKANPAFRAAFQACSEELATAAACAAGSRSAPPATPECS